MRTLRRMGRRLSASPTYRLAAVGFLVWNLAARQWWIAALVAPAALIGLLDTVHDEFFDNESQRPAPH